MFVYRFYSMNPQSNTSDSGFDPRGHGFSLWFTGLSGAGKSTIAEAVTSQLRERGHRVEVLDGDEVRKFLKDGENELLIDRNIDVTLADGRQMSINGFQVVDVEKFAALPDATVVAWHRSGWLALVHHHLSSLARFSALVSRQSALPADA